MTLNPNNSMVLLPPAAFQSSSTYSLNSETDNRTFNVYEQLEQLQIEAGRLRLDNEVLKTSGRDLLERAPPLINIPRSSNLVQETLEEIIAKQANEIDRLRHELEREKSRCLLAINELEQTLHNKEINWKSQQREFEIRSAELQKVRKEKLYYEQLLISQSSLNSSGETHEKLSRQLEQRERENASLAEEMRLLNLRLTSMNDVMNLQEEKLEQTQGNNQEKRQNLLNCWRTKVYDLLMQLKTMELLLKTNSTKFSTEIEQLQNKVGELLQENKILQTQHEDRKNQIQYLQTKLNQSESSFHRIFDENDSLKKRISFHETNEKKLMETFEKFSTNGIFFDRIKTMNETVAIFEQRIHFLNKRFLVLQSLFRRQIFSLTKKKFQTTESQTTEEIQLDAEILGRQLNSMTRDCDLLRSQLEQERHNSSKQIEQLQFDKKNQFETIQTQLEQNQTKIDELNRTIERNQQEILALRNDSSKEQRQKDEFIEAIKQQFQEREDKLNDERNELERQLNEAKREQSKSIANFRQIERTTTREKERWQRQLAEAQSQSESEIEKLKKKILALERERNLFMKTIHQEKSISPKQIGPKDETDVQSLVLEIRQLASRALDDSSDDENLEQFSSN